MQICADASENRISRTMNQANGFFHESYGYEGSITATILVTVSILCLICWLYKKGRLDTENPQ